jgi:hypothetical protein
MDFQTHGLDRFYWLGRTWRRNRGGYLTTKANTILLHRVVWCFANGLPIPRGYVVHHVDGDRDNNAPSNLEAISAREHSATHNRWWERPNLGR